MLELVKGIQSSTNSFRGCHYLPKLKGLYIWRLAHDRLQTMDNLERRNIILTTSSSHENHFLLQFKFQHHTPSCQNPTLFSFFFLTIFFLSPLIIFPFFLIVRNCHVNFIFVLSMECMGLVPYVR